MSVRTTADEHLDLAKEALNTSIKELSEIVISQCWGYDEFTPDATNALNYALSRLIHVRDNVLP